MPTVYRIIFATLALFVSTASYAEMYKWTDEQGQIHYTQTPPPGVNAEKFSAPPPPDLVPRQKIEKITQQQKSLDTQSDLQN